ncbi:MAG: response regulator transcription factor [Desulfobacula sp.]|jgi:DNA-binding NarL/FixJ family response regulator|uniref:response regulator n=1 Tax=Desulfobacula sp. TaxID=2593537 RepID=UPI001D2843D1|nr:response regulator transcription factor [Desulfobacula sp.]MBT3487812.1 response regulator transcription factor [Desulfobacula sp.]MBT3805512.1 response regulator transcription factor [Desulfobacula sp.]MBT4025908.1 response regulator transcription factor [Desulfobacula sp.]MBT4199136.1 response regulator transcription factor [Desulfobacula sp.]
MKKTKIIIADDHNILQHGLAKSLETEKGFEVVAKANSGLAAIELVNRHLPDLVIMDVSMPHLNGIEATKQILNKNPEIKVIALSMHMEKIYVSGMLKAGASGYILKSCSFKELLTCIKTVLSGKYFFCKEVESIVSGEDYVPLDNKSISVVSLLSEREREVLQLIAEGYKSRAIAQKLHISVKTVDIHRTNLKTKLNIHSIAELTKFAIAEGLTTSFI